MDFVNRQSSRSATSWLRMTTLFFIGTSTTTFATSRRFSRNLITNTSGATPSKACSTLANTLKSLGYKTKMSSISFRTTFSMMPMLMWSSRKWRCHFELCDITVKRRIFRSARGILTQYAGLYHVYEWFWSLSWKYYGAKRVTERRRAFLSSFLNFIRHTGLSKSSTRQKTERNRKWRPGGECPSEIARERSLGISSCHGDFWCLNTCCKNNTTYILADRDFA